MYTSTWREMLNHILVRPHTNCVKTSIKTWDKKDKSWRQHRDSDRCAAVFIRSFVSTVLLSLRHVADIVSWLLGRPHTNCVKTSIKTWDKKDKSWRRHHDSDRCAAVFIISFVSTVLLSLRHVADIVSWHMPVCGLPKKCSPALQSVPLVVMCV
jgi:hypothetical protein